jgi:hypothetical protein
LRRLLASTPNARMVAEQALAAPISQNDIEGVRVLLDAGADPNRYRDEDGFPRALSQRRSPQVAIWT